MTQPESKGEVRDRAVVCIWSMDWMRPEGRILALFVLPSHRLMTVAEMGREVLVGLGIRIRLRWPWGQRSGRARIHWGDDRGWRCPVEIQVRSDAGEIATRLAARAQACRA